MASDVELVPVAVPQTVIAAIAEAAATAASSLGASPNQVGRCVRDAVVNYNPLKLGQQVSLPRRPPGGTTSGMMEEHMVQLREAIDTPRLALPPILPSVGNGQPVPESAADQAMDVHTTRDGVPSGRDGLVESDRDVPGMAVEATVQGRSILREVLDFLGTERQWRPTGTHAEYT